MEYFVTMIDYGKRGLQAVVEPEMTRSNVIDRITSGEYDRERISFIHFVHETGWDDVTEELKSLALPSENISEVDLQKIAWDHRRDLAKNYRESVE